MVLLAEVATARTLVEVCPEVEAVATDCLRAACAKSQANIVFRCPTSGQFLQHWMEEKSSVPRIFI